MRSTLAGRLTAVLLVLLCLVGGLFAAAMLVATRLHNLEATQRFNRSLAAHLAAEEGLVREGEVDEEKAAEIFHMLMVVNPRIELYLLDGEGRILSYSAPPGKVRRDRVDLGPVRRLLAGEENLPVLGDDPRDPSGRKIFSAARLPGAGEPGGFLYVILGGEEYESVTTLLQGSYILRLSLIVVGGGMLFALLAAALFFHQLTRRLRRLAAAMEDFRRGGFAEEPPLAAAGRGGDEIARLGRVFSLMAARIREQIEALRGVDVARRELVSNVSHDLRTPLTSLRGYLETLVMKEGALSAEETRDYLATALKNCEELERRVDDLLELSRLDAPGLELRRESFPLGELVEALVQKLAIKAEGRGVALAADCPGALPFVEADIGLVERVIGNLVENALRSSSRGDRVTVALRPADGRVAVEVRDTGRGIPREDLPRIFDPHFRGEGEGRGRAGLGLAIARRVMELHGSGIDVESAPGEGTTFRFHLPAAERGES